MKYAGLTLFVGFAAFVGWAEAGPGGQRKVLQDFADKYDLLLKKLNELVHVTDPQLQKEIKENVERKLKQFEALLHYEGDVEPRGGGGRARQVLQEYLVSTEKQYAKLRQLLKTADPALHHEIKHTVETKLGDIRTLLGTQGRKASYRPGEAIA